MKEKQITNIDENIPIYSLHTQGTSLLPRERMSIHGPKTLSDSELLAVILGSGTKGYSVHTIAQKILEKIDSSSQEITRKNLLDIQGIGNAKSLSILATIELGRRIFLPRKWKIQSPKDIIPLLAHYADRDQEYFLVCTLNGAHEVISNKVISIGLLNRTLVHPREVFRTALIDHAAAIIIAHNHPSGNVLPSKEDIYITKKLISVSKIFDIEVLDHIIFSVKNHYSFHREGMLTTD